MLLPRLLGVDNLHQWHLNVVVACGEFHKPISSSSCFVVSLDSWSCRAQHHLGTMHVGEQDGCVATIVARCGVLLLVAGVVLLVNNHEPQAGVGQEHARAHTNYHARVATGQ